MAPFRLAVACLILLALPVAARAVAPGDAGYGLTVFRGNEIERFDVEVLGVLENDRLGEEIRVPGRSYLIRVAGERIERCGGISQGMSGSPVYIGEKLVGAVSSCWSAADPFVGLMIPIEEMRRLYRMLDAAGRPDLGKTGSLLLRDRSGHFPQGIRRVEVARADAPPPAPGTLRLVPAATRLLVSGLSGRRVDTLAKSLRGRGLDAVIGPGAGAAGGDARVPMVPGQAVGLLLCRGDVNVTTVGTLTETRRDGAFLAFGHEFEKRGRVEYFFAPCEIHHTFQAADMAFKIGSPHAARGVVLEDRPQGVAGRLDRMPRVCHLRVGVTDGREGRRGSLECQIVRDAAFLPDMAAQAVDQAIENVASRTLRETVRLSIRAEFHRPPDGRLLLSRENRGGFEDPQGFVRDELARALNGLLECPNAELVPVDLVVEVAIDAARRGATIRALDVEPDSLRRGGEARVRVRVERYRESDLTLVAQLPIPADLPGGEYDIVASAADAPAGAGGTDEGAPPAGRRKEPTLGTYLAVLADENRGDRVRLELKPAGEAEAPAEAEMPDERPATPAGRFARYTDLFARARARMDDREVVRDVAPGVRIPLDLPVTGGARLRIAFGEGARGAAGSDRAGTGDLR